MFKLETKELKISDSLRKKIEIVCSFAGVKYELVEGNIISVKDTNLAYVRPHILKIKGNDYLLFEDANIVFIRYSTYFKKILGIKQKMLYFSLLSNIIESK